jgi:hypothetical protein
MRDRYPVPAIKGDSTGRFGLVLGLTLVCWGVAWPFVTLGFINHYDLSDAAWIHALYQRKNLSLQRPPIDSRGRIVVVGGSGALFGIDAELIERKLGVTTVNDATHAGMGAYILDRVRGVVHPGDTILFCPEYELWYKPADDVSDVEWAYVSSYDKRYIFAHGFGRALRTLYSQPGSAYWEALQGWRSRYPGPGVDAVGPQNVVMVDHCGDLRAMPAHSPFRVPGGLVFADPANPACAAGDFRALARWARENRVRVLYSWPNTCLRSWPRGAPPGAVPTPASMRAFLGELGFISLNDPSDTIFPQEWFADTPYHVDGGCRRVRTEALIRRLRPYFAMPAASKPSKLSEPLDPDVQRAEGIYLVGAGTNWLRPGNTFAGRPGVQVKYLTTGPMDCPDAITPADLALLAARGVPIWFDDPAVGAMLPPGKWEFTEVDRVRESLGDWLARYNHHLFLFAHTGSVPPQAGSPQAGSAPAPAGLPPELRAALAGANPAVALIGTGPWAGIRRIRSDVRTAILEAQSAALIGRDVPGLALLVRADTNRASGLPPQSRVQANTKAIILAPGGPIAVAVIDPEQGILEDAGTFQGDGIKTVWSLRQVSLKR